MLIVAAVAAVTFALLARGMRPVAVFRRHVFIDLIVGSTVVVFVICAVIFTRDPTTIGTSDVNWLATRIIVVWTILAVAAALGYRLKTGRSIPV